MTSGHQVAEADVQRFRPWVASTTNNELMLSAQRPAIDLAESAA